LIGDPLAPADIHQDLENGIPRDAGPVQDLSGHTLLFVRNGHQDVFDADILVLHA